MARSLLALLLAAVMAAQTPPAPPPQAAPSTVIKSTTQLVQVSVIVHDKKGEPINDLKKEDFVLYDKGQEQQIRLFAMETAHAAVEPVPEKLPEGVVANRVWTAGGDSRRAATMPNSVTVILLDGLNTTFGDQHAAREGLIKFLQQIQPGDRVAIYTLGNGLKVLHDFTSDTASLMRALERYKAGSSWKLDASTVSDAATGNDDLDDFLNGGDDHITAFYQARRVEATLEALTTIANHLAGMAGRKNVIWLSGGFPLLVGNTPNALPGTDFQNYSEQMQAVMRTLNSVGVAIYPVDARGLVANLNPSMSAATRTSTRGGRAQAPGQSRADMAARDMHFQIQATMHEIADRTGGRAFMNTNDLTGAIRTAMNDTQVTYSLVYAPNHNEWDGKFREIKVKVNRGGVDVRYRKGYYAVPENSADLKVRQAAVLTAVRSPLLSTGLGLLAKVVTPATKEAPNARINFVVETKDISFNLNDKNQWATSIDIYMAVRDKDDGTLKEITKTMRFALTQEQYEASQKTGIGATILLEIPPKGIRVRAVVRDVGNGALGSLDIPL